MSENLIFSLDIGTRKVVGMVAKVLADKLQVIDVEIIEHASRTMLDGQIHNVNEVTKIVSTIKQRLEKRQNIKLQKVGVAVAGRALKTMQAKLERKISLDEEIIEDEVRNLELEAVSSVLGNASCNFGQGDFYCVGYSVVYYELDGAIIGNLVGHFGRNMAVEIIATFLPRIVLDSMLSVLRKAGLEVVNLTLEPIAAINVIIPRDMRYLNLLLLDIGAGTSDIALTKNGTVFAYGMVPEAGDEITETICEKYILDFSTAEMIKRSVSKQPKISFRDILGREHVLSSEKVIEDIRPRVKELSNSITNSVLELNQTVPHAVILVGGGSLTPVLEKELAKAFPIDEANIGIRLPEMISEIEDKTGKLIGPEMVTPIGICVMTSRSFGLKFIDLYVNDKHVQILDIQQSLDVLSALVAAGIDHQRLYGRIGRAVCVEVNGELKVRKGTVGKPAQIKLNNEKASLSSKMKNKDRITFKEAEDGQDAQVKIKDIIGDPSIRVTVNRQEVVILPEILMNGYPVSLDTDLVDRACIEYKASVELRSLLEKSGIDISLLQEREIVIRVNREPRVLSQSNFLVQINGQRATLSSKVKSGDVVEFEANHTEFFRLKDIIDLPPAGKSIKIMLNGQEFTLEGPPGKIIMNGQLVEPDEFLIDRAEIITYPGDNMPPTVSQVLKYLPINPEEQRGKSLRILVNGQPGGFTTQLSSGAEVSINFVDRDSYY